MALVPFSYANPFCDLKALPQRSFWFGLGREEVPVHVRQALVRDGKGGTQIGFGAAVYDAAFVLSHWLSENPTKIRGKRVLELGSGVGLVSIVAAKFGASHVVATDGDDKSVDLTRENVEANACAHLVHLRKLLWGKEQENENLGTFDVILGSDIVANPYREHFPSLHSTIRQHSKQGTQIFIAYKFRGPAELDYFSNLENDPRFVRNETIHQESLHPDFVREEISIMQFERV